MAVSEARTARNGAGAWTGAPAPGTVPGKRRRLRPVRVWAGLVVAVVCAGLFVVAARGTDERISVLVVERRVEAGQAVQRTDLREVELRGDSVPGAVPVSAADDIVGRVAVVPLVPGSLLSRDQVGEAAGFPQAGRSLVAVSVKDGGAPPGLATGQRVAVLAGPGQATSQQNDPSPDVAAEGVVVAVQAAADAAGGGSVVTLLVDAASSAKVAVLTDPRLVVLAPAGGGAG